MKEPFIVTQAESTGEFKPVTLDETHDPRFQQTYTYELFDCLNDYHQLPNTHNAYLSIYIFYIQNV